ncbi:putative mitochondrial carrier C8C9.12c [Grifola frondosa]|uniref:Putative mitochondrial carrier C8C9.12c n=1 Tax=Grifola frondosa TaxID=5627 RepID=A0A1C7MA38_GRIFR|nr:putative mitochondrial carrier C8C9.12c [Grifola frondosa]
MEPEHLRATYNDIHNLIRQSAKKIAEFKPDMLIAIEDSSLRVSWCVQGYSTVIERLILPALQRTFLKDTIRKGNIPIHAIGLSLYESLPGMTAEQIGNEVIRTQWLGPESGKILLGRRALIVDEVDDSRKTLHYAISELQKDVERELEKLPESERDAKRTKFAVFVVHNKLKPKLAELPADIPYFAGAEIEDLWLDYPWEAITPVSSSALSVYSPLFSPQHPPQGHTERRLQNHTVSSPPQSSPVGCTEDTMEVVEEIEYEGLPPNAGLSVNMVAGALAGITEHAVMFPVDSIKTRMQVFATSPAAVYTGIGNAFTRISSTEGMRALWRGVSSVIMGAGPAHAVHFGAYEAVKELAGGTSRATGISGWRHVHKSEFRSAITCARTVYRTEGVGAFYISYPTTLTMTVPFTAVQFTVYEQLKTLLNPAGAYSPVTHMISGGLSGAVAGAVTTPLDVAKTILQTRGTSQDAEIRHCRGLVDAFRIIWQRDGIRGFARGLTPRVLTFMPSNALCWLSYEFFNATIIIFIKNLKAPGANNSSGRVARPSSLTAGAMSKHAMIDAIADHNDWFAKCTSGQRLLGMSVDQSLPTAADSPSAEVERVVVWIDELGQVGIYFLFESLGVEPVRVRIAGFVMENGPV